MNVLGINTNVQPKKPPKSRKPHFPAESTISNESDDPGYAGFVFHQIGDLEFWGGGPADLRNLRDYGPWHSTHFQAVMRFGRNGVANGVYVIYDFYPEHVYLEERQKIDHDEWGYLPDDFTDCQISCAKIADKITDLGPDYTFDFAEALDYPVELVRAVKTSAGAIMRVTVA
ncbi:MAG: hypothetical protein M1840_007493 [Geoglossum simile]|nr:MAG: hypothetical protein M1840_007493 [Geoglossum simile]